MFNPCPEQKLPAHGASIWDVNPGSTWGTPRGRAVESHQCFVPADSADDLLESRLGEVKVTVKEMVIVMVIVLVMVTSNSNGTIRTKSNPKQAQAQRTQRTQRTIC